TPTATPTPTPTATPTATATADDGASAPEADAPTPPALPGQTAGEPSPPPSTSPGAVQAEGDSTQEVVAPPVAPAPAGEEVAAADGTPPTEAAPGEGEEAVQPPPLDSYGPQLTPSLGTAISPLTNEMADVTADAPLVLAPQVAGQPGQPTQPGSAPPAGSPVESGFGTTIHPVQHAAAATLNIVQPSWYATAAALLVLVAAAGYAAVLRQRGQDVPDVLAIPSAIRPGDSPMHMVRSIRPADLGEPQVRSIRP
ncbi:MAG TPA: hypothetical protein VMM13_18270, partial [Euzebya sp.]|nr:hypothetical protein [Euzebya sp.]